MTAAQIKNNLSIIGDPSLTDVLNSHGNQLFIDLNCHHLATIQAFDASKQTVQVSINYKQTYFDFVTEGQVTAPRLVDYPIIIDVPLIVIGGGTARITFPVSPGDQCLLLFNDRDIDNWYNGSTTSENATARLHAFSDAVALIGPNNLNTVIENYDAIRAIITNGTAKSGINPQENKLTLTNGSISLNDVLQDLCTEIKNLIVAINTLKVTGVLPGSPIQLSTSLDPATLTALTNVTTQITATATQIASLIE